MSCIRIHYIIKVDKVYLSVYNLKLGTDNASFGSYFTLDVWFVTLPPIAPDPVFGANPGPGYGGGGPLIMFVGAPGIPPEIVD